jgi:hypothetical protein
VHTQARLGELPCSLTSGEPPSDDLYVEWHRRGC